MALITHPASRFNFPVWQKALFLFAFAVVADIAGFSHLVVDAFAQTLAPVQMVWVKGMSSLTAVGQSALKLPKAAQRIQDLELRLAEASASLAQLETLKRENEELKFLLNNTDRSSGRTIITAPIIAFARPAIGVGSQAGIQPGAVVLSRSTLLGQVSVVSTYESQVVLLFEKDAPPVLAKTASGVEGLVVGDGRKVLLTQVPKDKVLSVGEQVVTLGQPQIEQNLPIGKISTVINDPTASAQSAILEQPASFFETPIVEVH